MGDDDARRLEGATEDQLARWSLRVLRAESLAAVFAE
jgi:hypothetical protein